MKKFLFSILVVFLLLPQLAWSAAPTFQAISAIAASTGADVTVTLPAHQADDILVLFAWVRDVSNTATVSGWTSFAGMPADIGTRSRYYAFWKRATSSSETNPLFDKSGTSGDTYAAVVTYRGAATIGNPFEVVTGFQDAGACDPCDMAGMTTLSADSVIINLLGGEDNNNAAVTTSSSPALTWTDHFLTSITGADGILNFSEAVKATAGAITTISFDFDVAPPTNGAGLLTVALIPPPATNFFRRRIQGGG